MKLPAVSKAPRGWDPITKGQFPAHLSWAERHPPPYFPSSSTPMLQKEKQVPGGTKVRWGIVGNWIRMGAPISSLAPLTHRVYSSHEQLREAAHGLLRTELSTGQQEVQVARYLDPFWPSCLQLGLYLFEFLINQFLPYRDNGQQGRARSKVMISMNQAPLRQLAS